VQNSPVLNYTSLLKDGVLNCRRSWQKDHESHFARVTDNFLEYLKNKNMPAWEIPNMLAKYYTTTKALEIALKKK
jgi:hypothetical protein